MKQKKALVLSILMVLMLAGTVSMVNAQSVTPTTDPGTQITNSMNLLGSMIDGITALFPHLVNLIIASLPLTIIGALIGAVLMFIYNALGHTSRGRK